MCIVIVGAGQAGANAAAALRQANYRGRLVLVGEELHLPYERPPLSKEVLFGAGQVAEPAAPPAPAPVFDRAFYAGQGIELRLGVRAVRIRRELKAIEFDQGSLLSYSSLILATGLRSRPLRGFDLGDHLFHLRTYDDAWRLKQVLRPGRRLMVIGGGLLGLEIAATASRIGCDVSVIERHPTLLYQSVAPVVGEHVSRLHLKHGVRILAGVTPRSIRIDEGRGSAGDTATGSPEVVAELSNGDCLRADLVVAATGSIPNTELAESAGLEVQDGIIVDGFGRSSDPDIYAIGDVARHFNPLLGRTIRVESWHNAQNQSAAVARVVAGAHSPYAEVPWFWSDQYDMNLQTIGYSSDWDRVIVRGEPADGRFTVLYLQGNRLVAANMINNGRDLRVARECIVEHIPLDIERLSKTPGRLEDAVSRAC